MRIRKLLKVIKWVILIPLLLFLLMAILIQFPTIQTKIIQSATSFVSDKTHTKFEIEKVSISFPKSLVIEGLFLDDLNRDTLVYVGKLELNISIIELFHKKVDVSYMELNDVALKVYNSEADSLFNYHPLLAAFSDTSQANPDTSIKTPWIFNLGQLNLRNIRLRYQDVNGGMNVEALLQNLTLEMDEVDLVNSIYEIDNLYIGTLTAMVQMEEGQSPSPKNENNTSESLPRILAHQIQIQNASLTYEDHQTMETLFTAVEEFELKNGFVDLEEELLELDEVSLAKSSIYFTSGKTVIPIDSSQNEAQKASKSNWVFRVKSMMLEDNSLAYQQGNIIGIANAFNPKLQHYEHLTLNASDLEYSSEKLQFSIKEFRTIDQHQFSITQFETDFLMDPHSISLKKLKIKTAHSSIIGEVALRYNSLESIQDSLPSLMANIKLLKASISNRDLLYFNPEFAKQAFFENKSAITTFSGIVSGSVNNLRGKNLLLTAGKSTTLKTNFTIKGLPDFRTAHFHFPNLSIASGKTDLAMILGSAIPENLELPETLNLDIDFNGSFEGFISKVFMDGSFGAGQLFLELDEEENFLINLGLQEFELGHMLKDTLFFGPLSLALETKGQGLDIENIQSSISGEVSSFYFNKYTYHQLSIDGRVNGQQFQGEWSLNDKNAIIDFNGLVDITPSQEQFKFDLNVEGADLKKLHLTDEDIQIALSMTSDLSGISANSFNGTAGITHLLILQDGEKYELDSLMMSISNERNKSDLYISSPLLGLKYQGSVSPMYIPSVLNQFVSDYFQVSETLTTDGGFIADSFNFELQFHKHPLLTEVLFPELMEFDPGSIYGSFDGKKKELKLNTAWKSIIYGNNKMEDIELDLSSDSNAIHYKISSSSLLNPQIKVDHFLVEGKIADQKIETRVSSSDDQQSKKLLIAALIERDSLNYKLTFDPHHFYLMDVPWNIASDNYILFGEQGFMIHHLDLSNSESQISINSVNNKFKDDLSIVGTHFKLHDIFGIIAKDSNMVRGIVNGNALLKRVKESYGIIANTQVNQLYIRGVPIGDLTIKADNLKTERFDLALKLSGVDNHLTAEGYYIPGGGDHSVHINIDMPSLSMKTIEALSMGQITEASGAVSGKFLIEGATNSPEITGELIFNHSFIKPAFLNNRIELKQETILLKNDEIYFNAFTLYDVNQHPATIDGSVKMKGMDSFIFALQVKTEDFLLMNTTARDNKEFFGKMIIDSKIDIKGPLSLPIINANVKMKNGSNFTIAVPETSLTTHKGQGIVEFIDHSNSILKRNEKLQSQRYNLFGVDLSSVIEIDKNAKLSLLMDPASSDSLVVQGEAALSFTMDRSGKMSLTGAYELSNGSYMVSLESIVKRRFEIQKGSTINWQGDPLDAGISIDASYLVRTSANNLVADQMTDLSADDKNAYKQRYPFLVLLKLRGEILHPEISFEIMLLPEDKGILGGAVDAKLNLLNENPSELNKQVFALLVLGRFVQENPLISGNNDEASAVVRATLSKFLSAELNKWSSKLVTGVELDFDIHSYDDYQSSQVVGRTQVDIGLKKQLFDERLSVKIGGIVDVEGAKAKQNSVSDITSDVAVEYELTKDGRYRLIGFSHNQYEGAIEGQVIETGVGIIYIRDFDHWKDFFKAQKQEK